MRYLIFTSQNFWLYGLPHCGINVKVIFMCLTRGWHWWIMKSFVIFDRSFRRARGRWHNYWGLLARRLRATSKDGETSLPMRNGRYCFSWYWRWKLMCTPLLVGRFASVVLKCRRPVLPGNLKAASFAGLSTAQFVKENRRRVGGKKWLYAGNARCSLLSWTIWNFLRDAEKSLLEKRSSHLISPKRFCPHEMQVTIGNPHFNSKRKSKDL